MTSVLISFSDFIRHYGLYLLLALILAIFAIKRLLRNLRIKKKVHQYLLYLPFCAYLIKSTTVARYIHTFGILFAASVSVLETMRVASSVVNNLIIREAFEKAAIQVREGKSISTALKDTHYLSPMALHLIGSGEKSGQISPMMQRAAAYLDTDVKRIIDTGLTLLEPLIILMMGAVVLFIVLATLLPIFSMEQLVT